MSNFRNIPIKYLTTAIILLLVYILNFRFDLVIDAGKYAAVSKNIFETGELIRLKILGEPYDQKPPFMFWLAALSFKIFGVSNFAFKLPTFLFTLFGTYATFRLGKALYGRQVGLLAAIMLISSQCVLLYNNDVHNDIMLTMCVIIGIWQLHEFVMNKSKLAYTLGFIFVGFAVITKGPIGLAIPVFSLLSHVLIIREFRLLSPLVWLPGLLIISLIALPPLIGLYQQFGVEGLKFFFWTNNAGRLDGSYVGGHTDFLFCFHTIFYLFLPFSVLLYYGAFHEIKNWFAKRFSFASASEGITLAIPIYLGILSLSKSQAPHYLLPVVPLIAIFTAKWIIQLLNNATGKSPQVLIGIQNMVLLLLIAGSLIIPIVLFPTANFRVWAPVVGMLGFLGYVVHTSKTLTEKLVFVPVVVLIAVNLLLSVHFFPEIFKFNATAIASRDFNRLASEKSTLYLLNNLDYEADFYAKNPVRILKRVCSADLKSMDDPWVYTDSLGRNDIVETYPEAQILKHYKYRRVSKISLKFLQPKKRFKELSDTYLIKIKN